MILVEEVDFFERLHHRTVAFAQRGIADLREVAEAAAGVISDWRRLRLVLRRRLGSL